MTDEAFKVMLELRMVKDPWPLQQRKLRVLDAELDAEAQERGLTDWAQAYHALLPGPRVKAAVRKPERRIRTAH